MESISAIVGKALTSYATKKAFAPLLKKTDALFSTEQNFAQCLTLTIYLSID